MRKFAPALLALLLAAPSVHARFDVTPSLSVRETYHDNLFLTEEDEEEDFVTEIVPAIGAMVENAVFRLDASYSLHFLKYRENTDLDEECVGDVQRAASALSTSPWYGFSLRASHTLERAELDETRPTPEGNYFVNKTERNRILALPEWRMKLPSRYEIAVGYRYDGDFYRSREGDDHVRNAVTVEAMRTLETLSRSVGLRAEGGKVRNSLTEDYDYGEARGFAGQTPEEGFLWYLDAGMKRAEPKEGEKRDRFVSRARLRVPLAATVSFDASGDKDLAQGPSNGVRDEIAAEAALTLKGRTEAAIRYLYGRSDYLLVDRLDERHTVRVEAWQMLGDEFRVGAWGSFRSDFTDRASLDADSTSLGATAEWRRRIFDAAIGYTFNGRDSEAAGDDFTANTVWAKIGAAIRD